MPETRTIKVAGGAERQQTDYIEPGCDEHAAMLGLREWTEGDNVALKVEVKMANGRVKAWTFADLTEIVRYTPSAMGLDIARDILRQRVNELAPLGVEVTETTGRQRAWIEKGKVHIEAPRMFDPDRDRRERARGRAREE